MDIIFVLGLIGGIFVLTAFFLTNWDRYNNDKYIYDEWLNFIGAALLLYYAWDGGVWPFVMLNIVWALWSMYRIYIFYSKTV